MERIGSFLKTRKVLGYFGFDLEPIEEFLKLMQLVGGIIIGLGVFFKIVRDRIIEQGWGFLLSEHILPNILLVCILVRFVLSQQSVRMEMRFGKMVFPAGLIPKDWQEPTDRLNIVFSVIVYSLAYVVLAVTTEYIVFSSGAMLIVAIVDYHTRWFIKRNLMRAFSNTLYSPGPSDINFHIIMKRRGIAANFFKKPHLWKEAGCVTGCAAAFALALKGHFSQSEWVRDGAYLLLITSLVLNEILSQIWRIDLYRRFDAA